MVSCLHLDVSECVTLEQTIFETSRQPWDYTINVLNACSYPSNPYRDFLHTPKVERIRQVEEDEDEEGEEDEEDEEDEGPSLIYCPKCKGPATWTEKQTRSADEATTQFCRCKKCHHTWRIN